MRKATYRSIDNSVLAAEFVHSIIQAKHFLHSRRAKDFLFAAFYPAHDSFSLVSVFKIVKIFAQGL
ncbi:MAG: hypothetical protein K2H64_02235 [Desulfovibrio sp.]|nr:hypothetical protein [Desulfovibrio sp.]